jgi:hypothetical protein
MENTGSKTRKLMRNLHNKVGYFIVGLAIIYALSGIVQTYRDDPNFLKHEVVTEMDKKPGLSAEQLSKELKQKDFKIIDTKGDIITFKGGTYNSTTGKVILVKKELYGWIKPFTELHKSDSKGKVHYFTILFAIALLFMCISAFWMFKPGTKAFSSGVILTVLGIIASILLVLSK